MKKYKIGKRLISAETPVQAVKIAKLLDSSVVKASMKDAFDIVPGATFKSRSSDDPWVIRILSVDDGVVKFQTMQKKNDREFANGGIETKPLDKFKMLLESRYRQTNSVYDEDENSEIEYLTKEEEQAVEDYRNAIKKTSNPKLLKVYAHILKEETEHIQELQEADVEDLVKDDRLSPMTYKKLKELGVSNKQWAGWTQEQANEYIRNKSQKGSKEKKEEEQTTQSDDNADVIKELSALAKGKPKILEGGEIEFEVSPDKFAWYEDLEDFLGNLGFKKFGRMNTRSGDQYIYTREVDGQTSAIHIIKPEKEYDFNRRIVKNTSPMIFTVNYQMQKSDSYWYK